MKRWMFNITTVLSLLLTLATVGLWVWSYWHSYWHRDTPPPVPIEVTIASDHLPLNDHDLEEMDQEFLRLIGLIPATGTYGSGSMHIPLEDWVDSVGYDEAWIDVSQDTESDVLWISSPSALSDFHFYFGSDDWSMQVPHWFLALIFAVLPVIWFIKWRKRRRLGPNACPSCGYDLTGNETGQCPECGAGVCGVDS